MLSRLLTALAMALSLGMGAASAAEPAPVLTPQQAAELQRMETLVDSLHPLTGSVELTTANVTLNLGEAYYFLDANDARRVLTEGWGNPPEAVQGVIGMIFPAGKTFMDPVWGAVLSYAPDGYVSDHDATTINYDQLLTDLRQGEEAENKARAAQGYPGSHLVGWAQAPTYDAGRHAMVWAKEIAFTDGPGVNTLNYDVRVLGRYGVFSMNMVTGMDQLEPTRAAANELMGTATFNAGARYGDYKDGVDKKAAYGMAGLVAGGAALAVAKKVGILGILLLILKKGAVFIIAGLAAAGGWLRTMFGGKKGGEFGDARRIMPAPMDSEPDPGLAPVIQPEASDPENPDKPR